MIPEHQLSKLVALYSQFHQALDPFEPEVLKAEEEFLRVHVSELAATLGEEHG